MKNILYFVSLFALFGFSNLSVAEHFKEQRNNKVNTDELVSPIHENDNVDIRKSLKQDLTNSVNQENELEHFKSDVTDVDNLNTKRQTQETESKKADDIISEEHDKNSLLSELASRKQVRGAGETENLSVLDIHETEATIQLPVEVESKKKSHQPSPAEKTVDEDFGNNSQEDEVTRDLPNVIEKENVKTEPLPLIANLNENTTDSQKDLQADKEINVKDSELSEEQLLVKKEEDTEEKRASDDFKDRNRKNREKPIAKDAEQNEKKNLQKWTKLNREPIKEWNNKNVQSKSIYKRQYDSLNEHLPPTIFIDDYSKQLFYCIKKNDLSCLRGIISKLEKIGLTTEEVLKFRNKFGDTPLIYAVKQSKIDIVRFLLLQGADPRVVDNNFQSPIDIAIERKQVDIINVIAEMTPRLLEHRKINNKESSEMYDWASKTKENNKSQCDEDKAK